MPSPRAADQLREYRAKRDFARTPEPGAAAKQSTKRERKVEQLSFVVHRHAARRLHYDLRLEWRGVYKSWAVTRGPSLDPADKRLAVEVEDHPLEYGTFEGTIPKPAYGGGTVQIWDRGLWAPLDPQHVDRDFADGQLKFVLAGERLNGGFVLVRMKPRGETEERRQNWLLIKERDSVATPGAGDAVLRAETSVASGRTLAEIESNGTPPEKPERKKPKHAKPQPLEAPAPRRSQRASATSALAAISIPEFVPPQLCRLVNTPPDGDAWVHELKLDGYRLQLRVDDGQAVLRTRTGLDWTARFSTIAAAAAVLPNCLIDGEVVALDSAGEPSFSQLQATLAGEKRAPMMFYAFDLLHVGDRDMRGEPLEARKRQLQAIMPKDTNILRFLEHVSAPGHAVWDSACRMRMEGIVSKQRNAPYLSGRGDAWTKAKCRGHEEFLVGGWSVDRQGRGLGALLVGARRYGVLIYLGRVGTGFSEQQRTVLLQKLRPLRATAAPFGGPKPPRTGDVTWVKPNMVVEVAYGGWTEDGLLRHASFRGIREDKPAAEVVIELPSDPPRDPPGDPPANPPGDPPPNLPGDPPGPGPDKQAAPRTAARRAAGAGALSHPDKVLWPAIDATPDVTKADLAAYYARYAERILAHVVGRPLSILRAPDGITGQLFFQRHVMPGQSRNVGTVRIDGQPKPFIQIDDAMGLAALAQISVVEIHPWGCHPGSPQTPDRLVFDLDPAEGLGFAKVCEAGLELRARLDGLGLKSFARVTGGKGLHVVVPLARPRAGAAAGWPEAKQFARLVCTMMARDAPDRYTTTLAKSARGGKIFLDYLRNDQFATAIASWSPRGRPGAPVARPVTWKEVGPGLDPAGLHLPAALAQSLPRDPWADFTAAATPLEHAIERITRQLEPARK